MSFNIKTMELKILNSKEIKSLLAQIEEQFEAKLDKNYVFLNNNDRIYIVTKKISKIDFSKLRMNSLGMYIGTIEKDGFRPSIEGSQLIGKTAKKNIVKVNPINWLQGKQIDIEHANSYVLIKYENDFLGSGKIKNNILLNYVPKERRLNLNA